MKKKKTKRYSLARAQKLPHMVSSQLSKMYSQSNKRVKKHPWQAAGTLLSLATASGVYFLLRYFTHK
jgi:hypothetical protein